jgi:quinol monooxygenase YgiN
MTIIRHYVMRAIDGSGDDLEAALLELAAEVRPLLGCEQVQLLADTAETTFIFIEHWRSQEDQKAAGAVLGKTALASVMPHLASPPESGWFKPL